MKKKIVCVFLCLLLSVCLLPSSAFARVDIGKVNVVVNKPEAGAAPSAPTVTTDAVDDAITLTSYEWSRLTFDDFYSSHYGGSDLFWDKFTGSEFEPAYVYRLDVYGIVNEGYTLSDNIYGYVNDIAADNFTDIWESDESGTIHIHIWKAFELYSVPDSLNFKLNGYEAGKTFEELTMENKNGEALLWGGDEWYEAFVIVTVDGSDINEAFEDLDNHSGDEVLEKNKDYYAIVEFEMALGYDYWGNNENIKLETPYGTVSCTYLYGVIGDGEVYAIFKLPQLKDISPKTSDNSNAFVWFGLMAASLVCLGVVCVKKKKLN